MTAVRFLEREGRLFGFWAEGHTGYASQGEDIVCSAVSALTQTALIGLEEILKVSTDWSMDAEKGMLRVRLRESTDGTEILLRTLEAGLKSIAEQYPGLVGIDYMQRR